MNTRQAFWPPEPEGVGQDDPHIRLAGLVGHIVQVALRVGVFIVDGGVDRPIDYGPDAGHRLKRPRRPQGVAYHRLGGADGDLVSLLSEQAPNGGSLHGIVKERGCAVGIDVVNLLQAHSGVLQSPTHRHDRTLARLLRMDGVECITGTAESRQLAQYRGAPGPSACSRASITRMTAPSAGTKPSRLASKGLLAFSGSSFWPVRAFMTEKPSQAHLAYARLSSPGQHHVGGHPSV